MGSGKWHQWPAKALATHLSLTCRPWSSPRWCSSGRWPRSTTWTGTDARSASPGSCYSRGRSTWSCSCPVLGWSCCTDGRPCPGSRRSGPSRRSWATSGNRTTPSRGRRGGVCASSAAFCAPSSSAAAGSSAAGPAGAIRFRRWTDRPWSPSGTSPWAPLRRAWSRAPPSSRSWARSCRSIRGTCNGSGRSLRPPAKELDTF